MAKKKTTAQNKKEPERKLDIVNTTDGTVIVKDITKPVVPILAETEGATKDFFNPSFSTALNNLIKSGTCIIAKETKH